MSITFYPSTTGDVNMAVNSVVPVEYSVEGDEIIGNNDFKAHSTSIVSITDNGESDNKLVSQYNYGTAPMTAEDLDTIVSLFGNNNPAVANGVIRNYDTTEGNTRFNAVTEGKVKTGSAFNDTHDFASMMDVIHKELYIPITGYTQQLNTMATRYNRFKLPNPDLEIKKGYAHVFFCRPVCHLLDPDTGYNTLLPAVKSEGAFQDIFEQNPVLVNEISDVPIKNTSRKSDFMYILSNYVKSFSLNDEELHSDTYGRTYTGYKISYGKTNIESRTAGSFSVTYNDDRTLSIYKIHRMWTDYINAVYRGRIDPATSSIMNKILDYAGSVYYILTAEDNETVLFWSKYYGVYPTTIPSSQYSWNAGSVVNPESITIQYNYSWKEDYQTTSIAEFNSNAKISSEGAGESGLEKLRYDPVFNRSIYYLGPTIVGTPYIERVLASSLGKSLPYTDRFVYKLRFVPADLMGT